MAVINFKAVGIGTSVFLISDLIFSFVVGFDSEANPGALGVLLLPIFILPGFVAGGVAKRHGVMNGVAVGAVVGLISLVVFLFPFQGQATGVFGASMVFGASAIFFASLGGLLWHAYSAISGWLRRGP